MNTKKRLILLTVIFALLSWVSESVFDYLFFYEAPLLNLLLLDVPAHEIYIRLTIILLIATFGFLVSRLYLQKQRTEEELRASEEKLRLALEGAQLGIWDWNIQTGEFCFNERWANMLGYESEEIEHYLRAWKKLVHPDDWPQVMEVLNAHLEGKTPYYETEHRLRGKSGDWVFVLDRGKVITRSQDGKPLRVAGTHLDITERKQAEMAILREKQNLTNMLQAISDGVNIINSDYEIEYFNPATAKEFGDPADKKCFEYCHGLSEVCPWCDLDKVLSGETRHTQRYYKVSQKTFDIIDSPLLNSDGSYSKIQIMRDITDLKQAEEAQRLAREQAEAEKKKTEAIIAAIGDGLMIIDTEYKIIYQNQVHIDLLGEHTGDYCYQAISNRDSPCHDCALILSFTDGQVHHKEREFSLKGEHKYFDITASPLHDAEGKVIAGIEVMRDITLRKLAEKELRESKEEVEAQNKDLLVLDKMKDGLIRDVSHELKTPVAHLSMQLEMFQMLLDKEPDGKYLKILHAMRKSLKRQEHTVHNILDLSRLEAGGRKYKIQDVRLDQVISQVLADYKTSLKNREITLKTTLQHLSLTSDEEMLYHVFSNLVNNAIKYCSQTNPRELKISLYMEENQVIIRLSDNGVGMTATEVDKAFDRFYQAEAYHEGSGVGLTMVKMIVEDLGGSIEITSPGKEKGITTILRFPTAKGASYEKKHPGN